VDFIKSHELFIKEIFVKQTEKPVKIIPKTTPSLKQRGVSRKEVMQQAKKIKNDEFYTKYEDIEKEIAMYDKNIWMNQVVFCNCDDAVDDEKDDRRTSAFALFFLKNFNILGLKKLICTHYSGSAVDLFHAGTKGYVFTKDGYEELKTFHKGYSGSFDDPISLKILTEEADIVCTNPPFSKSVEYWKIIVDSGKKFLIISNEAIVLTEAYIHYFKDKKAWAGYNCVYEYFNYKREKARAAGRWFTNLPVKDRPKSRNLKIMLLKDIPEKYKKYDDEGMLLVDNSYIPSNYNLPFAVSAAPILNGILENGYKIVLDKTYAPFVNGKKKFARVLVQKI
jgi:hypothetical protein